MTRLNEEVNCLVMKIKLVHKLNLALGMYRRKLEFCIAIPLFRIKKTIRMFLHLYSYRSTSAKY